MDNKVDLSLLFPTGYTPTSVQSRTLEQLTEALNGKEKFIILSAPTGSGKTFIAKTLSNATTQCPTDINNILHNTRIYDRDTDGEFIHEETFNQSKPYGTFILTITKNLQDQYLKFFPDMAVLKGKTNYQSTIDERFDVEMEHAIIPKRIVDEHQASKKCPYCNARTKALASRTGILNYKMFLSTPEFVKRRQLIVCDEASELENELIQRFSSTVEYRNLKRLGVSTKPLRSSKPEYVKAWVVALIDEVTSRLQQITKRCARKATDNDKIRIKQLSSLRNSLEIVNAHWYECEYVVEKTEYGVTLTPLRANNLSQFVFDFADKVILMSATIVNHRIFAKSLGNKDYKFIEVNSTFAPEQSPIYISTKYRLNYKNLNKLLPRVLDQVETILDEHKDQKGVIHTHSFNITKEFKRILRKSDHYKRFLFREDGSDNEHILQTHSESPDPTVLVSPSLSYGVDLKDELSRFQVVIKLPYPPLGSKRIKQLFDEDKAWYEHQMFNNLVQSCGRSTRNEDDYCTTYILDGNIRNIMSKSGHKLPKHFIDRFM